MQELQLIESPEYWVKPRRRRNPKPSINWLWLVLLGLGGFALYKYQATGSWKFWQGLGRPRTPVIRRLPQHSYSGAFSGNPGIHQSVIPVSPPSADNMYEAINIIVP